MIPGAHFPPAPRLAPLARVRMNERRRRTTHMAGAILLDYPDAERFARFGEVDDACGELPAPVASRLRRFVAAARQLGQVALAERYVHTFDMKRRCCLYLSYYLTGDTRRRGAALVRFAEAYRAAGVEIAAKELPDYLPMVLELSAVGDPAIGVNLLASHREGIEVLRAALVELGSPYADVVAAVAMALPPIDAPTRERCLRLVAEGPPAELVGVTAFGPREPLDDGGTDS
jgi:nitrate reductase delta subunit